MADSKRCRRSACRPALVDLLRLRFSSHIFHQIIHEDAYPSGQVCPADEDSVEDFFVTGIEGFEERDKPTVSDPVVPGGDIDDTKQGSA